MLLIIVCIAAGMLLTVVGIGGACEIADRRDAKRRPKLVSGGESAKWATTLEWVPEAHKGAVARLRDGLLDGTVKPWDFESEFDAILARPSMVSKYASPGLRMMAVDKGVEYRKHLLNSGWRSLSEQERLYEKYKRAQRGSYHLPDYKLPAKSRPKPSVLSSEDPFVQDYKVWKKGTGWTTARAEKRHPNNPLASYIEANTITASTIEPNRMTHLSLWGGMPDPHGPE